MAELDDLSQQRLVQQLFDFGLAPGRYAVHMGEPALLHRQLDTVLQWALGRTPETAGERATELKDAAVLFVLRSCFAAHNTLYQVLGVKPQGVEQANLKQRYRAMIRLAHPDMNVKSLPPNASALVNRAYEVLSDPEARSRYDAELANAGQNSTPPPPAGYRTVPRYRAELHTEPGWTDRWHALTARHPALVRFGVIGSVGVLAVVGLIWNAASDGTESRMLIASDIPTSTNRKAVKPEITQAKDTTPPAGNAGANRKPGKEPLPPPAPRPQQPELPAFERLPQKPQAMQAATQQASTPPPVPSAPMAAAPVQAASTAPVLAPAPPPTLVAMAPAAAAPTPPPPASLPQPPSPPPTVAPPATTPPTPTPAPAPAPSPTPAAKAPAAVPPPATAGSAVAASAATTPVAPATPVSPPPAPSWPVDAQKASTFLAGILNSLESSGQARQVNARLESANVKGSLLRPALYKLNGTATIERMGWTESKKTGVLQMQGHVVLAPDGAEGTQSGKLRFAVSAEFWGTRDGTVLASISLKEEP